MVTAPAVKACPRGHAVSGTVLDFCSPHCKCTSLCFFDFESRRARHELFFISSVLFCKGKCMAPYHILSTGGASIRIHT